MPKKNATHMTASGGLANSAQHGNGNARIRTTVTWLALMGSFFNGVVVGVVVVVVFVGGVVVGSGAFVALTASLQIQN